MHDSPIDSTQHFYARLAGFMYLWLKSNYIPRALAGWGMFSSLLVAICTFAFVIFPDFAKLVTPGIYGPIFIFEVTMGFWLVLKGLRPVSVPRL